jgi:hypothetical protein
MDKQCRSLPQFCERAWKLRAPNFQMV